MIEIVKLERGKGIGLPENLFEGVSGKVVEAWRARAMRMYPSDFAADEGCSSRANRAYLRRRGIRAVIPDKSDQATNRKKRGSRGGRPIGHDAAPYKQRKTAERCINRIKEWPRPAFRVDKTPDSCLAGLHLRGAILWILRIRTQNRP
ncbi:hypothetical protein ACFSKW_28465 [Nonomuraea mangrovi]|uniref:Transposase DDE domain-containing protein n=1 Tax=Nonomuraea mangrovi TaxID=2316207 RepID=A0ABW4T102_9ACTN